MSRSHHTSIGPGFILVATVAAVAVWGLLECATLVERLKELFAGVAS